MPTTAHHSLQLDRETLLNLDRSLSREWLETDGLGGYASSTVLACATRRYHGLLVCYPPGSARRYNFLSRLEESFHGGGKSFSISMSRYPGLFHPLGHQGIESFELVPWPAWVYQFGNARLERDVMVVKGQRTVLVRYRVSGQRSPVEMRLRPLLPMREADALTVENEALDKHVEHVPNGVRCRPYPSLPGITISVSCEAQFVQDPCWFKQQEYRADIARGYDGREDNYSPGVFHVAMQPGVDVVVAASVDAPVEDPWALWERESQRRLAEHSSQLGLRGVLENSARDFLYRAPGGRLGVIAGYPWFGEWGRDTFISLPGLTLARGDLAGSLEVLSGAVPFLRRGLLPNIFGASAQESQYNSADAALWFARAVLLHAREAGSGSVLAFRGVLEEIARCCEQGTELGLGIDEHGLLTGGSKDHNITWMDARTSQGPVTPRAGAAVELNALLYSLLAHLEELALDADDEPAAREWHTRKQRLGKRFVSAFWLEEGYLADVVTNGVADRSVRPNMVIAAALEFSPLTRAMRAGVVARAERELLTPMGLRTLAPGSPGYQPRYGGDCEQRDRAYHQGTVWPWLLGFHVEACLRARGNSPGERARLAELLGGFESELSEAGLLQVSEVFDAEAPHRPGGTIAQAWSTAELLRAYRMLEQAGG